MTKELFFSCQMHKSGHQNNVHKTFLLNIIGPKVELLNLFLTSASNSQMFYLWTIRKALRLALKLFDAFPFKRWVSKFEDWTQHQFHSACTGIYVVPRKSFFNVARLTASNSDAHNILWIISFPLFHLLTTKSKPLANFYNLPADISVNK